MSFFYDPADIFISVEIIIVKMPIYSYNNTSNNQNVLQAIVNPFFMFLVFISPIWV